MKAFFQLYVTITEKYLLFNNQFNSVEALAKGEVMQYIVFDPDVKLKVKDKVNLYALQVMTLRLLWAGFYDSIKEGEGDRIFIKLILYIQIYASHMHSN